MKRFMTVVHVFVLTLGVGRGIHEATAANIGTVMGAPGSAAWSAACPVAPSPQVPIGTSQLTACSGPQADCLHRVDIDLNTFPRATCSDGTPGVFYIREGSGADADKWVIHLQGGGGCRDYESCQQRWCGQQGALPYTANKMSSDWDGDGVPDLLDHAQAGGMASTNPNNNFATWTHVFAYYCSSDSWQGDAQDVTYTDGVDSFTLDARGHRILVAMRRMLRKKNANPVWTAVDRYTVPDLDDAKEIIFTGTSAGAKGAIMNVDWFLRPFDVKKTFVLDANMDISDTTLINNAIWVDTDNDGVGDDLYYSYRIGMYNDMWDVGGYFNEINAFVDESCRNFYEPLGRMDRCSQISTLLRLNLGGVPLIETPTFVRFDLEDSVVRKFYVQQPNLMGVSMLIGGLAGTPVTVDDYAVLARETLLELYDDHDSVTGVIAPRCGQHVGLEDTYTFGVALTPDTDEAFVPPALVIGTDSTVHDALWDWVNPGGTVVPSRRLDTDEPGNAFSGC